MPSEFDDTDTGPIGAQAYSAAPDQSPAPSGGDDSASTPADANDGEGGGGVNWPTVLVSGGVAAIISALVVTIGVVGLLLSDIGQESSASSAQPTVVNLGSAQGQVPQAPGSAVPSAGVPPAAGAADPAMPPGPKGGGDALGEPIGPPGEGSSADLPSGGGASGGGLAPGAVPEAAPGAPQQQAPQQQAPQTSQTQSGSRSAPTVGQLQSDLDYLVGGAPNGQKAQRLEGGQRAVNQAQPVIMLLQRFKPLGFEFTVVGPVTVNGNTAKATLELRSPGYQPARMPVYWVWQDGRWKLSNRSICDIGSYAQIPCSL
ncbi:hypothetical protein V1Y59_03555 [Gordonia sp. PKS22-38]|uniref:Low molecular weight antigen MTB12-like C-terminal domain-containing protein n=1 Tax=Gordonia prachuapensis TaxID=3115651 RepID=A0ABU7MP88_9ACTN|nr:hypothetical protein [Gordonia sp. PKS22-38]